MHNHPEEMRVKQQKDAALASRGLGRHKEQLPRSAARGTVDCTDLVLLCRTHVWCVRTLGSFHNLGISKVSRTRFFSLKGVGWCWFELTHKINRDGVSQSAGEWQMRRKISECSKWEPAPEMLTTPWKTSPRGTLQISNVSNLISFKLARLTSFGKTSWRSEVDAKKHERQTLQVRSHEFSSAMFRCQDAFCLQLHPYIIFQYISAI